MTGAPLIFTPEYYERMHRLERLSWWNAGMREMAAMLLREIPLQEIGTLLDAGCGSGDTMTWFEAIRPSWRTLGFDVAEDALRRARHGGASVFRASALSIPLNDHCVDLVITFDVLQHLPLDDGDLQALREIRRVLRPGGHLLLRTNAQSYPNSPPDRTFQFRKYTTPELRQRLTAAGFHVELLSRVNWVLGLAEIPRELAARRTSVGYHGLLAEPRADAAWVYRLKLQWLRWEGALVRRGVGLPGGRSIVALCSA